MGRVARGKGRRATPVVTAGLSDVTWRANGQLSKAHGVFFDTTGFVRKSGGVREYVTWSPNPLKDQFITAMIEFRVPRGPSELVVAWAGNVGYLRHDDIPTANRFLTGRYDAPTAIDGDRLASHNNWLFVCNGRDANMKWNGAYTAPVGVAEIPSPPSADTLTNVDFSEDFSLDDDIATSGGTTAFRYRCSFVSSSGHEGPPSEPGTLALVGDAVPALGQRAVLRLTGLSPAVSADVLYRNIYKRAEDGDYYFWRQVSVHEDVVYDHEARLSSASEGSVLNPSLQPPPVSKYIGFFRGRGYYVPTEFASFVFYSDSGFVEQLSSGFQFLDVSSGDGESITGLAQLEDSLLIFKATSIWQVSTLADGTPVLTPVAEGVGCVAPASIAIARGRAVFVAKDGVYEYDGGSIKPISNELRRWWKNVEPAALRNAVAIIDEESRRLYVGVPADEEPYPSVILSYHYDIGGWTLLPGYQVTAMAHYKDNLLLGVVTQSGIGDIVVMDIGGNVDVPDYHKGDGTGKPGVRADAAVIHGTARFGPFNQYETVWSPDEIMEILGITVYFERGGDYAMTVNLYKDRSRVAAASATFSMKQTGFSTANAANQDLKSVAGWGEKDWGQSTWTGPQQLQQHVMFADAVYCREFEVEFVNANADEPFALAGFIVWRNEKGSEAQR